MFSQRLLSDVYGSSDALLMKAEDLIVREDPGGFFFTKGGGTAMLDLSKLSSLYHYAENISCENNTAYIYFFLL